MSSSYYTFHCWQFDIYRHGAVDRLYVKLCTAGRGEEVSISSVVGCLSKSNPFIHSLLLCTAWKSAPERRVIDREMAESVVITLKQGFVKELSRCWASANSSAAFPLFCPLTPCFVHRVDAKSLYFERDSSSFFSVQGSTEVQSPCSVEQGLRLLSRNLCRWPKPLGSVRTESDVCLNSTLFS